MCLEKNRASNARQALPSPPNASGGGDALSLSLFLYFFSSSLSSQ